MSLYRQRLEACEAALRRRQTKTAPDKGGWGIRKGSRPSIPNTAEALAVLKASGADVRDPAVRAGVEFVRDAMPRHIGDPDRGPYTRYAAWTVFALTEYPEARRDRTVEKRLAEAVLWLYEHSLSRDGRGGWPEQADENELSAFATSVAVTALDRAGRFVFADAGREALVAAAIGRRPAWAQRRSDRTWSPAHTALAIMALSGGSQEHRALAEEAMRTLLDAPERWCARVEQDRRVRAREWVHITPSLGARAWLTVNPHTQPLHRAVVRAAAFCAQLWDDDEHEWRGGDETAPGNLGGDFAVVRLAEALRRYHACRLDPFEQLGATETVGEPARLVLRLEDRQLVAGDGEATNRLELRPTPARWELLATLVELSQGDPRASVAENELLERAGLSRGALAQARTRLNRGVRAITADAVRELVRRERAVSDADARWSLGCRVTIVGSRAP